MTPGLIFASLVVVQLFLLGIGHDLKQFHLCFSMRQDNRNKTYKTS